MAVSGLTSSLLPPDLRQRLAELLPAGRPVRFGVGQKLLAQGDRSGHIAIITSGVVKITASVSNGREALLGLRGAGEVVGELAALDGQPHSATVRALDDVRARLIATSTFRQHLRSNPDALLAVLAAVVTRLRESDRRRLEFSGFDVPQRVSLLLVELAQTHGQPGVDGVVTISLALSQEEIAEATGASREAVAKALRRLREEGTVLTGRRRIVIKRMDRLIGHSEHE